MFTIGLSTVNRSERSSFVSGQYYCQNAVNTEAPKQGKVARCKQVSLSVHMGYPESMLLMHQVTSIHSCYTSVWNFSQCLIISREVILTRLIDKLQLAVSNSFYKKMQWVEWFSLQELPPAFIVDIITFLHSYRFKCNPDTQIHYTHYNVKSVSNL